MAGCTYSETEAARYAGAFRARFSSHGALRRAAARRRGAGEAGGSERGRGTGRRREGESASRVSGSVGRVTERFRVPLAPALTRLPDTVTSVIREYPPRAVSPFSLKHAAAATAATVASVAVVAAVARSTGRKTSARGRAARIRRTVEKLRS